MTRIWTHVNATQLSSQDGIYLNDIACRLKNYKCLRRGRAEGETMGL